MDLLHPWAYAPDEIKLGLLKQIIEKEAGWPLL